MIFNSDRGQDMDWTAIIVAFITGVVGTALGWFLNRHLYAARIDKTVSESEEAKAQSEKAKADAAEALATAEQIEAKIQQELLTSAERWINLLNNRIKETEIRFELLLEERDKRIAKLEKDLCERDCQIEKLETEVEELKRRDEEMRGKNAQLRHRVALLTKIVAKEILNGNDYRTCVEKLCEGISNVSEEDRTFLENALEGANDIEL